MGRPGCPEFALFTPSMDKKRIVLTQSMATSALTTTGSATVVDFGVVFGRDRRLGGCWWHRLARCGLERVVVKAAGLGFAPKVGVCMVGLQWASGGCWQNGGKKRMRRAAQHNFCGNKGNHVACKGLFRDVHPGMS